MVGRTNGSTSGSGGFLADYAVIHISATAGSSLTLLKNGIVVKVIDSSYGHINSKNTYLADYYYPVPPGNFGEWKIASDSYPAEKSVLVNSNRVYDVEMTILYLYNHGVYTDLYSASNVTSNASVTDNSQWIYINGSANSIQDGYKRWASVDLTHFNTITSKRSAYQSGTTNTDRYCSIFIAESSGVVNPRQANIKTIINQSTGYEVITEITLDISDVTGIWYVAVGINTNGSKWNYSRKEHIHEVKLS